MLPELWRTLHLSPKVFYLIGLSLLLLAAVALGLILTRVFGRYARKFQNTWAEVLFALLEPLPVPLLILAALYTVLEVLTLPPVYERLGSKLISCLVVLVVYYFPAKVVVLFLGRVCSRNPVLAGVTHFLTVMTRALFVLLALYTVLEIVALPPTYERLGSKLAATLGIALIFYALAKVVSLYLSHVSRQDPALQRVTNPAAFVVRLLFALLAVIIILDNLGVHLTAVWTTLGVGSVAVALALQETLSNLFAGLYLLADRPINPGDYVKMDSGQEGYVVRVGWRSTKLITLGNNIVVVPNSTMTKAVITNYTSPEPSMSLSIIVGVAFDTDPSLVERVLVDLAKSAAAGEVEGLLPTPEPFVRLIPGFGASTLDFTLNVQVRRFVDQFFVQHELRKRILARFQKEGIDMPFPTRTVLLGERVLVALGGKESEAKR